MKTTIDLPDELVREVKLRAVMEGRTVKDLVTDCLSRSLGLDLTESKTEKSPSPAVEIDATGLPVIRCAQDAEAASMTVEELLELERETQFREDLDYARVAD